MAHSPAEPDQTGEPSKLKVLHLSEDTLQGQRSKAGLPQRLLIGMVYQPPVLAHMCGSKEPGQMILPLSIVSR